MISSPYATTVTKAAYLGKKADPSLHNKKPYRSARLKAEAREKARIHNGTHVSSAGVLYHEAPKKGAEA